MGRWCIAWWDFVFPRNHSICRHVWPDRFGVDIYDYCVRRNMQRKYIPCHRHNIATGHVWYVLWICYIGHLWTGTECNPIGIGIILSDTAIEWSHLADRRNAVHFEVSKALLKQNLNFFDNCFVLRKFNFQIQFVRAGTYLIVYHWHKPPQLLDVFWQEDGDLTNRKYI